MAWNIPGLMMEYLASGEPRSSGGTWAPSMMTEMTMMNMPTRAKPDARASLEMSLYKDNG